MHFNLCVYSWVSPPSDRKGKFSSLLLWLWRDQQHYLTTVFEIEDKKKKVHVIIFFYLLSRNRSSSLLCVVVIRLNTNNAVNFTKPLYRRQIVPKCDLPDTRSEQIYCPTTCEFPDWGNRSTMKFLWIKEIIHKDAKNGSLSLKPNV